MSEELKPCPFCGGAGILEQYRVRGTYFVECTGQDKGCAVITDTFADADEAVHAWNTRFPDISAKVDALRLAAETFRRYEALHRAKPDHVKADSNAALALQMEHALQAPRSDNSAINQALDSSLQTNQAMAKKLNSAVELVREFIYYINGSSGHKDECNFLKAVPRPPCSCGGDLLRTKAEQWLKQQGA